MCLPPTKVVSLCLSRLCLECSHEKVRKIDLTSVKEGIRKMWNWLINCNPPLSGIRKKKMVSLMPILTKVLSSHLLL